MSGAVGFALAVVTTSPLIGIAVSLILVPLVSRFLQAVKAVAYRNLEGRHYEYKGKPLEVFEDLVGDRWVRIDGVRRIVTGLPRDAVLARIAPDSLGRSEEGPALLIRAQALEAYLRTNQNDGTIRFRNWLQREVISPADRAKARGAAVARSATHLP